MLLQLGCFLTRKQGSHRVIENAAGRIAMSVIRIHQAVDNEGVNFQIKDWILALYRRWRGNYCGFESLMRSWISAASLSASATCSAVIFFRSILSVDCPFV